MAVSRNRGASARNLSFKIWVSEAERQAIDARAGNEAPSSWLRQLALGQPEEPTPRRVRLPAAGATQNTLILNVCRLGNQLEQIARGLRACADSSRPIDVLSITTELAYLREELHHALESLSPGQVG